LERDLFARKRAAVVALHIRAPLIVAAIAAAAPVRAEEPTLQGGEVVVRAERPPERAPTATTTTVEAGEFKGELKPVAELLATAPGVAVRDFGGLGQMTTASVRGASADQVLVLLDGVPLNAVVGGGADLSALPEAFVERVEVVRGAEGAAYGSGALGGALEVHTQRPRGAPFAVGEAAFGSWLTWSASAAAGVEAGRFKWLAGAAGRGTRGDYPYLLDLTPDLPRNDPLAELQRNNNDALFGALLLRGGWEAEDADRDAAIVLHATLGERGLAGAVRAPTPEGRERDARVLAGGRARWGDALPLGELTVSTHARLDGLSLRDAGLGAADVDQRALDGALGAGWSALIAGAHKIRAGLQVAGETVQGSAFGGAPARLSAALSASDIWNALPGFYLHAALRGDLVGADAALLPRAGALWKPLPWLELRANAGAGFRAPSFGELYMESGPVAPNPDLHPERAWGADAGVAARAQGLYAAATAFALRYEELIVYELFPPFRFKPFNAGASRVLGAEVEAAWSPIPDTTIGAAYTFLDARPESDGGKLLPYRAPHRAYLRAAHKGPLWEAFAEAHYTAAFPRNRANTKRVADRVALNAGAGLRVWGPFRVSLEVKNLLDDRTMEDVYGYPLPARSFFVHVRAEPPPEDP
jgi:outer membrane cobalamin receptor